MRRMLSLATVMYLAAVLQSPSTVSAQSASELPEEWIQRFSDVWQETAWGQRSRRTPDGYMRDDDDRGWETRMLALQGLVRMGAAALPALHQLLQSGDDPQRILAAQALGYLAAADSRELLLTAAGSDENPAVRLYAVDSLGMLGPAAGDVDWQGLLDNESVGDVKKHVSYAIERDGAAVDPATIEALTDWDPSAINSIAIGEAAPDFELQSAQGDTIRLGDYRGKKAVVLVFIYGDT